MPIRSQIRFLQITGSLPSIQDLVPAVPATPGTATAYVANDLSGSLSYFARALQNIHGNQAFGNQTVGLISHAAAPPTIEGTNSTGAQSVIVRQHGGASADDLRFELESNSTVAGAKVLLQNVRGTATDAIRVNASAGTLKLDGDKVDINATKEFTVNGNGFKSHMINEGAGLDIRVLADADAEDLLIEVTNDGSARNSGLHLKSAGTGLDSIKIETTDGGIDIDTVDLFDVLVTGGNVEIATNNSNASATLKAVNGATSQVALLSSGTVTLNSANTTQGSMQLSSGGGIDVIPADALTVDIGRASQSRIVVSPNSAGGGAGSKIDVDNVQGTGVSVTTPTTNALSLRARVGGAHLSGQSVVLSGSGATAISFAGDGAMTSGPGSDGMLFGAYSEYAAFRGKPIFAANTTVIGALNAAADAIGAIDTSATIFTGSLSETAAPVIAGTAFPVGKVSGDANNLALAVQPHQVQVFLNGQLLLSRSQTPEQLAVGAFSANDYVVSAQDNLKFEFGLRAGDFVQVIDRS